MGLRVEEDGAAAHWFVGYFVRIGIVSRLQVFHDVLIAFVIPVLAELKDGKGIGHFHFKAYDCLHHV